MKWIASIAHPKPLSFEIEESKLYAVMDHPDSVEYTLYVYENDRPVYHTHQDALDIVQEIAFEKYQVPLDAWKQVD
ncbi:MAG: hypothetical protein PHY92_01520 [Alphaproteobacteria bacterium]|nr:hypothetical protein [Alphaproteobacteria bacterium]